MTQPTSAEIEEEADRLFAKGLGDLGYSQEELLRCGKLTWKINNLKKIKQGKAEPVPRQYPDWPKACRLANRRSGGRYEH